MKKVICLILSLLFLFSLSACGKGNTVLTENSNTAEETSSKILVAYFSCTGNTETAAKLISGKTDGELYRIVPQVAYTKEDLNYKFLDCRANKEQNDETARPAIAGEKISVTNYDTIFIGYPIWWGKAPKIISTFMESTDLSGKTIIPFCTSGSSDIDGSLPEIRALAGKSDWRDGKRFPSQLDDEQTGVWLDNWLNELNLMGD